MRFLDGPRRQLDIFKVEELALEGDGLSGESAADDFEGLVGARAALLGRHAEAGKLFPLKADPASYRARGLHRSGRSRRSPARSADGADRSDAAGLDIGSGGGGIADDAQH